MSYVSTNPLTADSNMPCDNAAYERRVAELVNRERTSEGLQPLAFNIDLAHVSRVKSRDMKDNNYFSHVSLVYGTPFDMLAHFGIPFKAAAENIAFGQRTPEAVMDAWTRSPMHRNNILNPVFTDIGVGYACGGEGGAYWTQIFIAD